MEEARNDARTSDDTKRDGTHEELSDVMSRMRPHSYISLFSGIEAASVAWEPLGWQPQCFSEIEPFPSAVLSYHYPDVPNLGDMTKVDWTEWHGKADVVVGGSPCFVAGTPVLTEHGYVPIESVQVGDVVVTHTGRLRRVSDTGHKQADRTIVLSDGSRSIECTENHPFYSRLTDGIGSASRSKDGHVVTSPDPSWTEASSMLGLYWLNVGIDDDAKEPEEVTCLDGHQRRALAYVIGMWSRCGGISRTEGKAYVTGLVGDGNVAPYGVDRRLTDALSLLGIDVTTMPSGTDTLRLTIASYGDELYDIINRHLVSDSFGREEPSLPLWCMRMGRQETALMLRGWADASRYHVLPIGDDRSDVAMALRTAEATYGTVMTDVPCDADGFANRDDGEGDDGARQPFVDDSGIGWWQRVTEVGNGHADVTVYNLEVEDDHSYVVSGIAVHNCQSYSVSGLRRGLDDPRGQLMLEYLKAARDIDPEWIVWENVPGVLSSHGGRDFQTLLDAVAQLWDNGGAAWRVLDAQYFGVPQRRRRVFLVVNTRDWRRAAAVLSDTTLLQGNPRTVKEVRAQIAGRDRERPGDGGKRGNDGDGRKLASAIGQPSEDDAVAFVQNSRNELRLFGGDGRTVGALSAQPGSKQQCYVMTSNGNDYVGSLCARDFKGVGNQYVGEGKVVCVSSGQSHASVDEDVSCTITSAHDRPYVVGDGNGDATVTHPRRLTPEESERLQAFPAGWTRIPWHGKPADECPDGPRYKAIGNSMCVNVMRHIGEQIMLVDALSSINMSS